MSERSSRSDRHHNSELDSDRSSRKRHSPSPHRKASSSKRSPPPERHSSDDRDRDRERRRDDRGERDSSRSDADIKKRPKWDEGPSDVRSSPPHRSSGSRWDSHKPRESGEPRHSGHDDRVGSQSGFARRKNKYDEEDDSKYEYGKRADEPPPEPKKPAAPKEKPNFELSGKLSEDQRKLDDGTVLKYQEPSEAHMPTKRWRLYVFKGDDALEPIPIHRQTCYLFGRDRKIADIPVDHPSCSKQHAVLQFRDIRWENDMGEFKHEVRPYVMDLQSTNGVYLNKQRIDHSRYYELKEKDVVKFGFSSREFVLLHEGSTANM